MDREHRYTDRRDFIKATVLGMAAVYLAGETDAQNITGEAQNILEIRKRTLGYIENMRFKNEPYGQYRYSESMSKPTLYSSTYAAMTRHLYHDLDVLKENERREWIDYIQSFQDEDGLFRDPVIFGQGWYEGDPEWCGRRHLTCHVVTALKCLGSTAKKPMSFLDPFMEKDYLVSWLESRDWVKNADFVGNEVLNLGTLIQYARDFQGNEKCAGAAKTMTDWMSTHFIDKETGLWGEFDLNDKKELSRTVQAAYHLWLLYFYDKLPIPYSDKVLVNILKTQNSAGGFGQGVHNPDNPLNSSACEDIDSIDPLARLLNKGIGNKKEITAALKSGLARVFVNMNADGGFVFMRDKEFEYGHEALSSGKNESAMFPTWFRTLTIAYVGKAVPDSIAGEFDWQFCNCPGIQFWRV